MADVQLPSPPEGYAPGQTRVPVIWGITISFCMMTTILAALRLYVRVKLLRSVGKDDWLLIAALAFIWVLGSLTIWGCNAGLGRHMYDLAKEGIDSSNFFYLGLLTPLFYNLAQLLIQLSLLTFYFRLPLSQGLTYITYALMTISTLNATSSIIANLIFHLVNTGNTFCKGFKAIHYVHSSVNFALDFAIWCLPISSIWRLQQLGLRKRLAIIATFSVGLFCCLSGVVRSVYIHIRPAVRGDEQWDKVPVQLLCIMETTLAISGASMAVLKPLLAKFGCIGDTPVISPQGSNPNQQEPGQGNNTNSKRNVFRGKGGSTYTGPNSGRGTFAPSATGTGWGTNCDEADMHIEGDDSHATGRHGRPTDIELGELDESIHDESCDQYLALSNSVKSRRASSSFGMLRSHTIEARHERIYVSESTVSLAGIEAATRRIAPSHHHHSGHRHEVNTLPKSPESISSSLNIESQHATDLLTA